MRPALRTLALLLLTAFAVFADTAERRTVSVLVSSDTGIYADALAGFVSSFNRYSASASLEPPVYVDALQDPAQFFAEHRKSDLLVTIGSRATQLALAEAHDSKIVFSMVSSPRVVGVSARDDVCGTSMDVSLSEFFDALREISPQARSVYAFYSTPEGEFAAAEGDYLDLRHGLNYYRQKLAGKSELPRALEAIKGKADAFYIVPDALYDSEQFQILSEFCKKNKIILMTSFSSLMQAGATFSLRPDYTRIGTRTAEMAGSVLEGKGCGPDRVLFPEQVFFSLNERYAEESGLAISSAVKEKARRTKLFLSAVNLMNDRKPKSAQLLFKSILAKDPSDKAARRYLDALVEQQRGPQTRQTLDAARRFQEQKAYDRAIQQYESVRAMDPDNREAQRGIEECRLAISEQLRERGDAAQDPYEKARQYRASLQQLPTNTKSSASLDAVRARQKPLLADYLKKGIADYNAKEFDSAVHVFDNILLIDPANREAQEYLRIATRKRDALRRLQE